LASDITHYSKICNYFIVLDVHSFFLQNLNIETVHLWLTSTNIYPYLTFNVIWAILYFHLCLIFGQVLFRTSMTNILFIFFYLKCHNLSWKICWEILFIILKWPFLCWSKLCCPTNWGLCYTLGCDGASLLENYTLLLLYFGQEIKNCMRKMLMSQPIPSTQVSLLDEIRPRNPGETYSCVVFV
jgi:hypothetical protein